MTDAIIAAPKIPMVFAEVLFSYTLFKDLLYTERKLYDLIFYLHLYCFKHKYSMNVNCVQCMYAFSLINIADVASIWLCRMYKYVTTFRQNGDVISNACALCTLKIQSTNVACYKAKNFFAYLIYPHFLVQYKCC